MYIIHKSNLLKIIIHKHISQKYDSYLNSFILPIMCLFDENWCIS